MQNSLQHINARLLRYWDTMSVCIALVAIVYVVLFWRTDALPETHASIHLFFALSVVFATILSTQIFSVAFRVRSIRYLFSYPSVSLATMVLLLVGLVLMPRATDLNRATLLSLGVFLTAVVIREVNALARHRLASGLKSCDEPTGLVEIPESLVWVQSEKPISNLANDKFGHAALIKRLTAIIEQESCKSFGLTGLHGSGKSSVVRMVEAELKRQSNMYWFVYVSGWGRSSDNISSKVLESIVRQLHEEGVEATSLLSWPADYMRELLGDSSFLTRLLRCHLSDQQGPTAVLQKLDPVLDAINRRIVVVLEDVDRNSTNEGMNTLCHMLDDFGHTRNVSFFFLKSEETTTNIDFHRLCEHTEMIPNIDPNILAFHLSTLVNACQEFASEKKLIHADRLNLRRIVVGHHFGESFKQDDVFWNALCTLAHTPRCFKHALRRIWREWQSLAGEVDLLDLILWSLLREGCPVGYDYLRENLQTLRQLPENDVVNDEKNKPIKRVREQIANLPLSDNQQVALKVVLTLFGFEVSIFKEESFYIGMSSDHSFIGKNFPVAPQSIKNTDATDYFKRLEAGALDSQELSDQIALRVIDRYVDHQDDSLPDLLARHQAWVDKMVQFEGLLPTKRLVDVIEDHIRALGRISGGKARAESSGFIELRKIARTRGNSYDEVKGRLESFVIAALDFSMELAQSIYEWYVDRHDQEIKRSIRDSWIAGLRERIANNDSYLCNALDPEYPYGLFHTMRFRDEYPTYNTPQDWQWLTQHLIKSIEQNPAQIVPDVVCLFIRDLRASRMGEGAWFELDVEFFEGVCPTSSERARIASLLIMFSQTHNAHNDTAARIQYIEAKLKSYCEAPKDQNAEI